MAQSWPQYVSGGLTGAQRPPLLKKLNIESINAGSFLRVMAAAHVPLVEVSRMEPEAAVAEVQRLVGLHAGRLLDALPEGERFKDLSTLELKAQIGLFSDLRSVAGVLPPSKIDDVLANQSELTLIANRRSLGRIKHETREWFGKEEAGNVPAGPRGPPLAYGRDSDLDAFGAKKTSFLRRHTLKPSGGIATREARAEPPSPTVTYEDIGFSEKVTIDGEEFARTNRGIEDMRGYRRDASGRRFAAIYPEELVDVDELGKDGVKVLDVGTGTGDFVLDLRARGVDAVGIDPYLSDWQKSHPSAFRTASAESLPYPDSSFDYVYSNWSLLTYRHGDDKLYADVLREMARVLKPGGRIRISPFLAHDLEAILAELPELRLNPDMTYENEAGLPFNQRDVTWKGKTWTGDPFVELIRRS